MATTDLTAETFGDFARDGITFVDWWAAW